MHSNRIDTDPQGSGMGPVLTAHSLFRPYRYQDAERRARTMQRQEDELRHAITGRADDLGLRWYHPGLTHRDQRGFPDLVLAGPGGWGVWELKSDAGRLSLDQVRWGALLSRAPYLGYMLVRPDDFKRGERAWQILARFAG